MTEVITGSTRHCALRDDVVREAHRHSLAVRVPDQLVRGIPELRRVGDTLRSSGIDRATIEAKHLAHGLSDAASERVAGDAQLVVGHAVALPHSRSEMNARIEL